MMNALADIVSLVGRYSPVIVSGLGSPAAGLILNLLSNAFGSNKFDLKELAEKIKTDPDTEYKLKQLELLHQNSIAEINDIASARNREVSYTTATKQRDWMLPLLAVIVTVGFFITIGVVIQIDVPQQEKYFLYGLIFGVGVQFAQVYNYYFGRGNNDLVSSLSAPFIKAYNTVFKHKP